MQRDAAWNAREWSAETFRFTRADGLHCLLYLCVLIPLPFPVVFWLANFTRRTVRSMAVLRAEEKVRDNWSHACDVLFKGHHHVN